MLGLPVIGLATTEMATVIENGVSGYVDTDLDALIAHMQRLIAHPDEARHLSAGRTAHGGNTVQHQPVHRGLAVRICDRDA